MPPVLRFVRLSNRCLVFVEEIPTRLDLQNYLDQVQIPITLSESLDVKDYCGFVPIKLAGNKTGVEIYIDEYRPDYLPEIADKLNNRTTMITFSYAGDASAIACAYGAATALAKHAGALVYCDRLVSSEEILAEFEAILPAARNEAKNAPHSKLLQGLTTALPNFARKGNIFFHMPLGQSARGLMITPLPRNENFEVGIVLWPLMKPTDRFPFCYVPPQVNIQVAQPNILEMSTARLYWRYQNPNAIEELVDITVNKLTPFFESTKDPQNLAQALLSIYRKSTNEHCLEQTGLACAAAGQFDEALELLARAVEMCNKPSPGSSTINKLDWVIELENRCNQISQLIRNEKFDDMRKQFEQWRAYTIKKSGLSRLDKATNV